MRKAAYFSEWQFLVTCVGFITSVFALSFVGSIVVEMPFLNLDKILFPSNNSNQNNNNKTTPPSSSAIILEVSVINDITVHIRWFINCILQGGAK